MSFFSPLWIATYEGHELAIRRDSFKRISVRCDGSLIADSGIALFGTNRSMSEGVVICDRCVQLDIAFDLLGTCTLAIDNEPVPLTLR